MGYVLFLTYKMDLLLIIPIHEPSTIKLEPGSQVHAVAE